MRVVLLGPPGAGKGTQAPLLAEKLGVPMAASGDLFRDHRRRDTELGRMARTYMDRGALVPDEVTIRMVMEWIDETAKSRGFLLDGFPRTVAQADALAREMEDRGGIDRVLYIRVPSGELIRRLSGRLTCGSCRTVYNLDTSPPNTPEVCDKCGGTVVQREDDKPEAVRRRLQVYADETEPLVEYYRDKGILAEVDGVGPVDAVNRALEAALSGKEAQSGVYRG